MNRPRRVEPLGERHAPEIVDVLLDAFEGYPVMRFVLGEAPDVGRLRALIEFFVAARVHRREPILGVLEAGRLDAVALVSFPDGPPSPPELAALRERTWTLVGAPARERYEAFSAACSPLLSRDPHIHLNMIGARRNRQGAGLGGALLERVQNISQERPGSRGVTLTTEDQRNLRFYERHGFRATGNTEIAAGLRTWALFRPNDPGAEVPPSG